MEHWSRIVDARAVGLQGNQVKSRVYSELWLEMLQADGEMQVASRIVQVK